MAQSELDQTLADIKGDVVDLYNNAGGFTARQILLGMVAGGIAIAQKASVGGIVAGAGKTVAGAAALKAAPIILAGVALGYAADKGVPRAARGLQRGINRAVQGARWVDEQLGKPGNSIRQGTSNRKETPQQLRQKQVAACQDQHRQRFCSAGETRKLFRQLQDKSAEPLSKKELYTLAALNRAGTLPLAKDAIGNALKQIRRIRSA